MTLTELKYLVALAQDKHFGRAAETCNVSQPTLSLGIQKLEKELNVLLFERRAAEVTATPIGQEIIRHAQDVLSKVATLKEAAKIGKNPLVGPLRLGVIYTIAPYILPGLVKSVITRSPQMQLMLQENFTVNLLEMLRASDIDCAILAEPFDATGLAVAPLYEEPFFAAVPIGHPLASQPTVTADQLNAQTLLLLGSGHCFRDHVLDICPESARQSNVHLGIQKTFEGSSLETIKFMVAAGLGVTVVPGLSVPAVTSNGPDGFVKYIAFSEPVPSRKVVLVWRRSFPRYEAIAHLRNCLFACELPGVKRLT